MCGLGRLFHCLEDSIYRTHFIFPHTLSVAGEWLLVEHLTPLSLHSLVYSLKHFLSSMPSLHKPPSVCEMHCTKVFLGGGGCCGGNLCSSSFLVHSSSLWLHQSPHHHRHPPLPSSSILHCTTPFQDALVWAGLGGSMLAFQVAENIFFPPHWHAKVCLCACLVFRWSLKATS